jgi:hypothetical protein
MDERTYAILSPEAKRIVDAARADAAIDTFEKKYPKARVVVGKKRDYYNPIVAGEWTMRGIPEPTREFEFAKESFGRKHRFDFCWPAQRVYLEIDGGNWTGGRHTRPEALARDYEKRNLATLLGWRGLWCEPKDLVTVDFMDVLKKALEIK